MSIKVCNELKLAELRQVARTSPRKRTNYNLHRDLNESPSRFYNVMCYGSYFTPHRHFDPPKSETFIIIDGEIAFIHFNEIGEFEEVYLLSSLRPEHPKACQSLDVPAGLWHGLCVLSKSAICFEVKPGPYSPLNDKEFATFAPKEGESGCQAYLEQLESKVRDYLDLA